MWLSPISIVLLAQSLSIATASPFDQTLDITEPPLVDTPPNFLTTPGPSFEDSIFFNIPEDTTATTPPPDLLQPISLFPETSPPFDTALGFGSDNNNILLATNECYPKERACCLGLNFSQCFYAPSAQCSEKKLVCCTRVDSVSRDGFGCEALAQTAAVNTELDPQSFGNGEELWGDETEEEWLNSLWGL